MRLVKLSLLVLILCISRNCYSQETEKLFLEMRKWTSSVGYIQVDSIHDGIYNKKALNFKGNGSGIISYLNINSKRIGCFITAKHVIESIKSLNKLNPNSLYIRPSSADTIKTWIYYGLEIFLKDRHGHSTVFYHPDKNIDLAVVILTPEQLAILSHQKINYFPNTNIKKSHVGNKIWVYGYPGNVETYSGLFSYSISTFKSGYITWTPETNIVSPELKHISIIESGVTPGNSGSPVFSIKRGKITLTGIVTSVFKNVTNLELGGKPIIDSATKQGYLTSSYSGSAIIENSDGILTLLQYVSDEMEKRSKK